MFQIYGSMAEEQPVQFAAGKVREWLKDSSGCSDLSVFLEEDRGCPEEGYHLRREKGCFRIVASDRAGMMYGLLDLGRELVHGNGCAESIKDRNVTPYIRKRGIKFNIPLDARTPSYSDASDSAFETVPDVWDLEFWQDYLDAMAEYHYNVLSLWSLSPFPSMVRIPEYPLTALEDVMRSVIIPQPEMSGWKMYTEDMKKGLYPVKKMSMDEKMEFWRQVMSCAADRCIEVYLFTWNLFVYGTEDCLKCHPGRKLRFIHRMQYAAFHEIEEKFRDFPGTFEISFKYSQAHMHSSVKPHFFSDFIKEHDTQTGFWLTLRDDDYYMFRWGDLDFARDYLRNMPVSRMTGFYLGADGFTWGRDYMDRLDQTHPLYIRKMWYKMWLWGQLSYDISREEEFFTRELECMYGMDGKRLSNVWKKASRIISTFQLVHWHDYDFQWYPEMCCSLEHPPVRKLEFADINEFMACDSMPEGGCISVKEFAKCQVEGRAVNAVTPLQIAQTIKQYSEFVLKEVALLEKGCKMGCGLHRLLMDMRALAYLGKCIRHL